MTSVRRTASARRTAARRKIPRRARRPAGFESRPWGGFENMPEIKWPYGYPFALTLMALAGLVLLVSSFLGFSKFRPAPVAVPSQPSVQV